MSMKKSQTSRERKSKKKMKHTGIKEINCEKKK